MAFPLTDEQLHSILSTALSKGGEYADIFLEDTRISSLELQDGTVSQAQQVMLYGAGIRVVQGTQTGYAYTMDLSPQAMLQAARFAGSIQQHAGLSCEVPVLTPTPLLTAETPMLEPDASKDILLSINKRAHEISPLVVRVKATIAQRMQNLKFVCSEGTGFSDNRPRTTLFISIVIQKEGKTQMGFGSRMYQRGAEFITPELIEELLQETVQQTLFLFDARQIEGGEMPVVMAAGSSGILMHEAIGHAFEADFIRTGESIFTGKLGQRICNPNITIVDDGTLPYDAGMLRYDDEGTTGQKTTLVEKGILASFLHDRISARHFGVSSTGNGRRESFRHMPLPRMRSTYMCAGDATEEDIIRSVKRGIYAQTFTNGQVQIGAGDFTFFMKKGYLIEDGHLTTPIRDMNIIGNGPQALQHISMVGNNLKIDHSAGMCGKGGQRVGVSQGLPTVLVDKLVVG
ncbi:MAG: TldD/PmbA family protein [Bacteroidaceae bacterium]|nr:TldD/PmbA family protein [Bacteroidaceae bacterium]